MQLKLTEEQNLLVDTFARFFKKESTTDCVRQAETSGYSVELWQQLVELGTPAIRVAEQHGGAGYSLREIALVAREAGRYIAPVPLLESAVTAKLLSDCGSDVALAWLAKIIEGSAVVSIALHTVQKHAEQVIPYGTAADAVIALDGDRLILIPRGQRGVSFAPNLGTQAISRWNLLDETGLELSSGETACSIYGAAVEEWKLLTASQIVGICEQSLHYASEYCNERTAFGVKIGTFQGLSHPLAKAASAVEGAQLLVDYAIWSAEHGQQEAAAYFSMAYWWATEASHDTMPRCVHVFGGYGVSEEHDIQLYARRGLALTAVLGDRQQELLEIARRAWCGKGACLPTIGTTGLDFDLGPAAEDMRQRVQAFFDEKLTPELAKFHGHSWEGYSETMYKELAKANLLFPDWPEEWGGLDADIAEMYALQDCFYDNRWTMFPQNTSKLVGEMVQAFGSESLQAEVLPQIISGEAICCLGLTEPHCGSDVFAAKTKAVKQGDNWLINGQKMFTSGADISKYVMLLTNTDPEAPKHVGKTLFLVPMDHPGVEVHRVDTISADRSNITYYTDVEIPDEYRLGDVNAGSKVMGYMLTLEQGGAPFGFEFKQMVKQAIAWAQSTKRNGQLAIEDPLVQMRLATAAVEHKVAELMLLKIVHNTQAGCVERYCASMLKAFVTESWKANSANLVDMAAPDSLFSHTPQLSYIEEGWRSSLASCIYAGSTQVHLSVVAENGLGLPRSR